MAPRKTKSSIPGVAEVPMPPAARSTPKARKVKPAPVAVAAPSAPKPIRFVLTSDKTGARLFVGKSPAPVATLFRRDLIEAGKTLGIVVDGVVETSLRAQLAEVNAKFEKYRGEYKELLDKWDKSVYDEARTAEKLAEANQKIETLERGSDTARYDADQWQKAARKNLADLEAANAKIAKLNNQLDRMAIDLAKAEKAKAEDDATHAVELARAKKLGWLYAGSVFVLGVLAFIELIVKGGR